MTKDEIILEACVIFADCHRAREILPKLRSLTEYQKESITESLTRQENVALATLYRETR